MNLENVQYFYKKIDKDPSRLILHVDVLFKMCSLKKDKILTFQHDSYKFQEKYFSF